MEKIEVTINEDKVTAKEVNPYQAELDRIFALGRHPSFGLLESFRIQEDKLRTFELESIRELPIEYITKIAPLLLGIKIGTKHQAEVLPNGKVKIL